MNIIAIISITALYFAGATLSFCSRNPVRKNNSNNRIKLSMSSMESHDETRKTKVLMVDDEDAIHEALGEYLLERGYEVTACVDADTALDVCITLLPDVIISDILMPGEMNGLDLLSCIRLDKRLASIPVILLTAKGMSEDRIEGYKAGADAYAPKPFDPDELVSIIENVVSRHESLNRKEVDMKDLKRDLDEIKYLLKEGGAGIGKGWVKATNVFLNPDEKIVLEILCKGLTNKEIAKVVNLSTRRVEQHITSMFRKTGVGNRTELVRWAVSTGNVEI